MPNKKYVIFLASIVSLGGFLFGFDAAVISGVNNFITAEFNLSSLQLGWVVSSVTVSSAVAMLLSGVISDWLGRKKVLITVALLYSISAILSALAPSYSALVLARLLGGLAFGAALVLVPVYIAETVPAKMRGAMVSINQLAIVVGFSAAYFSNFFFLKMSQSGSAFAVENNMATDVWRWMLGVESIPALLYFFLLFLIPNSPRWLTMKGREGEAEAILTKVNDASTAQRIMTEIKSSLGQVKLSTMAGIKEVFSSKYRRIMTVALIVGIAQMSVGINAVFFYATNIFELTGIGTDASFSQSVWVGIINVVFTLLAIMLIDKVGRRPLLLIGIAGIAISLMTVAFGFSKATYNITPDKLAQLNTEVDRTKLATIVGKTYDSDIAFTEALQSNFSNKELALYKGDILKSAANLNAILILIGILGFVACFAFSLGPVMWVLLSEIFPNHIRGIAISLVGFINSMTSLFVVGLFPWELDTIGNSKTFLIYAIFAIVSLLFLLKLLPETKGKTLEEIEKQFTSA